jgi:nitrate reductase gamma subunit
MDWNGILEFARGPFFYAALMVFVAGLAFRLVRVLGLGWHRDRTKPAGSRTAGVAKSYAKGFVVWPFVPWVKQTFAGNAVTLIAGGIFHLGLFATIFLGTPHMLGWKSLLGFGWPSLPLPIIDWLAAASIAALVALGINRLANPLLRKLSGPADALNWLFVFLPMVTGYMTTHNLLFRYEVIYSLHVIAVNVMLIWIPFSRIGHFVFYFFSRSIHGSQFGRRAVTP